MYTHVVAGESCWDGGQFVQMKAGTVYILHNRSCEKETDNGGLWRVLSLSSSRMLVWHAPSWSPAAQDTGCLRRLLLDQKADSPSVILQVAFLGKKIWPWKTLPQPSLQTAPPGTLWMMGKAEAEGCRGHNPPLLLIYECPGLRSNIQNSTVQANPLWSKSS